MRARVILWSPFFCSGWKNLCKDATWHRAHSATPLVQIPHSASSPRSAERPSSFLARHHSRRSCVTCASASTTHLRALLGRAVVSVQLVRMSTMSRVHAKSPRAAPPSWETRSISRKSGWVASSHSAEVRTVIWCLRSVPDLVPLRPLISNRAVRRGESA